RQRHARAWRDGIATQWIPDPADSTRCVARTYAELAGMVTRIANALTALGVRRGDAVTLSSANTSMLYAATLAAQAVGIAPPAHPPEACPAPGGRAGRRDRRPGHPRTVQRADRRADPPDGIPGPGRG